MPGILVAGRSDDRIAYPRGPVEALTRREAKLIADLAADISMRDVQTATKVLRELKNKFASGEWKRLLERVR